ncbi:MAG: hypothetical protein BWZ07_03299 [Alphaproteobacteria bacterium ADurb.BinA280]|nr:MAG: hypothetical protein BWZ07_03299 [Alphaproteobacteria bacterium ADurb.BinA280]
MPCQWIEVSWPNTEPFGNALETRTFTVVPSRQRNKGAGSEPLTVTAVRARPLKLTDDSPMARSNSVPESTTGVSGDLSAQPGDGRNPICVAAPAATRPCTNRRRDGMGSPLRPGMMGLTDMNAPKCRDLRFQTQESHVSWDAVPTMGHALSGARSTRDVSGDWRSCQVKKLRRKIPRLVRGRVHPECRAKGKLKACDRHRAAACHARAIATTGTTSLPCSTVSIVRVGNPRQVMIRRVCVGRRRLMAWSDG